MKKIFLCLALLPAASLNVHATVYTYSPTGNTTNWSDTTNWTTNGTTGVGYPSTTSDTANLTLGTGSQTVNYDANASGLLGTLNMTNTGTGSNAIDVTRASFTSTTTGGTTTYTATPSLAITSALTLGTSTAGTNTIILDPQTATPATNVYAAALTVTNGLTLNAGGLVELRPFIASVSNNGVQITGAVTLSGGTLAVEAGQLASGGTQTSVGSGITSTLTISGTSVLSFGATNPSVVSGNTTLKENRLVIGGNFTATGGSINLASGTTATIFTNGATNSLMGLTGLSSVDLQANRNGNVTISTDQALNNVFDRLSATGTTLTLTSTNTTATGNIRGLSFIAGGTGTTTYSTFALGSNFTVTSAAGANPTPIATTSIPANTQATLALDLQGHTLDLTLEGVAYKPANPSTSGNQFATLNYQSTGGTGTIKAVGFDFTGIGGTFTVSGTTTAVAGSNIGAGVTLQSTGTTNNLGTPTGATGTFSATSTFLYSGTAVLATPATLVSNRTIGILAVTTGALNVAQAALTTGGAVTVNGGGTLALNGTGYGTLTLGAGNFAAANSTLSLTLGANLDQIAAGGTGQSFSLDTVTIAINGTASAASYQVFTGFTGTNTVANVSFTGVPSGETASIDTTGLITFATAVPEPAEIVQLLIAGSVLGTGIFVSRRRRKAQQVSA